MTGSLVSAHPLAAAGCAAAAVAWLALAAATVAVRRGHTRRLAGTDPGTARAAAEAEARLVALVSGPLAPAGGMKRAHALAALARTDHPGCREFFTASLQSPDPELRQAAVAGLGALGERHGWAIDALVTALTLDADTPARIASHLRRLRPRPGGRLVPLLSHPSAVVRFWALRLLADYGGLAHEQVVALTADGSADVRAAALATLRATADPDALRSALRLLDDAEPRVRAHACRAAIGIGGLAIAPFVVPHLADDSWWVREAAQESLRSLGADVAPLLVGSLEAPDPRIAEGVAVVLQDVGLVDRLVSTDEDPGLIARIFAAGGSRLRAAAEERHHHVRPVAVPAPLPT